METTKNRKTKTTPQPFNAGGLGAHPQWEQNTKKAKRDGLEYCRHCGKGMIDDTGYIGIWDSGDDFWPFEMMDQAFAQGAEFVRLGPNCAKQFTNKEYFAYYFVPASTIQLP